MPRHPTVQVPNIGPMDHAWDLLGEWQAEFELPETEAPMHGKVMFRSWTDAELQLDPVTIYGRDSVRIGTRQPPEAALQTCSPWHSLASGPASRRVKDLCLRVPD